MLTRDAIRLLKALSIHRVMMAPSYGSAFVALASKGYATKLRDQAVPRGGEFGFKPVYRITTRGETALKSLVNYLPEAA